MVALLLDGLRFGKDTNQHRNYLIPQWSGAGVLATFRAFWERWPILVCLGLVCSGMKW